MVKHVKEYMQKKTHSVTERSVIAGFEVFTSIYNEQLTYLQEKRMQFDPGYDATIFIDTTSENCLKRSIIRGRKCESKISLFFLKQIEMKYQKMILKLRNAGRNVFFVDGNHSKLRVVFQVLRIIHKLLLNKM